jgi:hypothetical protein
MAQGFIYREHPSRLVFVGTYFGALLLDLALDFLETRHRPISRKIVQVIRGHAIVVGKIRGI